MTSLMMGTANWTALAAVLIGMLLCVAIVFGARHLAALARWFNHGGLAVLRTLLGLALVMGLNLVPAAGAASESGHAPNRVYIGQDGNFYLNGATVYDGNGNAVLAGSNGNQTITGTLTVNSASAGSLNVGPAGATNPVLNVDSSVASQADGVAVQGKAAGSGTTFYATSSGATSGLTFGGKGSSGNLVHQPTGTASGAGNNQSASTSGASVYTVTLTGGDTDVSWNLVPKGAGTLQVAGNALNSIFAIATGSTGLAQATTTYYAPLTGQVNTTEANAEIVLPGAVKLGRLYAKAVAVGGSAQTLTLTVRKNEGAGTLTCQIATGATTCNDTAHADSFVAGDRLAIQAVTSATTGTVIFSASASPY